VKLRYKATDGDEDHLLVVPVRAGAESRLKNFAAVMAEPSE